MREGLVVFEQNNETGAQIPFTEWNGHERGYDVTAIAADPNGETAWVFVQNAGHCQYQVKN